MSLISEDFIKKSTVSFKSVVILPINNTTIKTANDKLQKINKQAYRIVSFQGIDLEIPVLIVKNLIYDGIGTDTSYNILNRH